MLKSHSAPFNCKRNLFDKQKHYPKKFADAQCQNFWIGFSPNFLDLNKFKLTKAY